MKKIVKLSFAFISVLAMLNTAQAQERQTLISLNGSHGGFGGMHMSTGMLAGKANMMVGGYGAYLMDNRFYIGGGGMGAVRALNGEYEFGYGGVLMGYFFKPHSLVHLDTSVLIGAGGLAESNRDQDWDSDFHTHDRPDAVFVLEPKIALALNVAPHTKMNLGVSYRYVDSVNSVGLNNESVSGFNGMVSMTFGLF